jgi:hypothetical protein
MPFKSSVFSGPTNVMALGHPFVTPYYHDSHGMPIGIDVYSREVVYVDFWALRAMGVIFTKYGIFFGDVGFGKSTALKIIAIRMMAMAAGFWTMRTSINDYKPESGHSEYGAFSAVARSKVISMASMSFNPFEARLFLSGDNRAHELGVLDVARSITEYSKDDKLSGEEFTALRIAFSVMIEYDESFWEPHLLYKIAGSITTKQIEVYFKEFDDKLLRQLEERIEKLTKLLAEDTSASKTALEKAEEDMRQLRAQGAARDNFDVFAIQRAGVAIQTYGYNILRGPFGSMFGTSNSLYDLYSQRAVTKDWRNILPEAETLIRIIDNNVRMSSIENGRLDLIPHVELDDEKHKSMDDIGYARSNAYMTEIARSTHTVNLSASHRPESLRKGAFQSEQWRLGETVLNNMGFAFIGHQQNRPEILNELGDRYRLGVLKDELPYLPAYTFVVSFGPSEPPRVIRTFVTPNEMALIQTESATENINKRPDVMSAEDLRMYAEVNGYAFIGQ